MPLNKIYFSKGVTVNQEKDVNDLTKIRDELSEERDQLLTDITQIRRDLDDNSMKQTDVERQIREGNDQVANLQEKINNARAENLKETRKRVGHLFFSLFVAHRSLIF